MIHSNKKSQFSGFKSPSKVSLVRSKSTDHLTSTHKSIKRKNVIEKTSANQVSMLKMTSLTKTKSVKSLKAKNKAVQKNSESKSTKKIKSKLKKNASSDSKTVKKSKNIIRADLSQQSFNSIESFKINPLQYFFYQNTYIPIQNSAQRRFVIKIKQIDKQNDETKDTFFKRTSQQNFINNSINGNQQSQNNCMSQLIPIQNNDTIVKLFQKIDFKDTSVQTQQKIIIQYGTNTTPRIQTQICIQTQNSLKYQEDVQKCFSQTLNDLEFLFLPDENNFKGFSKPEKLHYKELLQSIAQKIWANGQNFQELTDEKVQLLLYHRQCIQMGMIECYPQDGFPTHVYAVMSYLTNLFSFAQSNYKYQALQKIHNIYGYTYQERFSRLLKDLPTKKKCNSILSEEVFLTLQKQLFKDHQFGSQLIQKSVHIHNKAVFDSVNEQLQKFKPFYYSKGEPFPWSIDVGMTFFSIDQSTISLLFKQIKQKILIKFGFLCGILIDYDEFKEIPKKEKHSLHIKKLQLQQQKMIQEQIKETNYAPEQQEWNALTKCDISTWILAQLLDEACIELNGIYGTDN